MRIIHEDGSEFLVGPGDGYIFEPGYDAWVVGIASFVGLWSLLQRIWIISRNSGIN